MVSQQKVRVIIWTGGIAAITVVGAWSGAGIKLDRDVTKVARKSAGATAEEKIAMLEQQRGALMAKKLGLEKKLSEIEARKQGASWEESRAGRERKK